VKCDLLPGESKPSDLDACPVLSCLRQFCGTTNKLKAAWFWDSNQETVVVILKPKSLNHSCQFWGLHWVTRATDFEAKPEKTVTTGFETKPEKIVATSFEAKPKKTVDHGFKAQPRNTRS
jgi:hypothetical protein